ncbi:MAG TPA: hypothetical protein VK498_14080 [Ferruginibacter sp.]|nr:hypothetical protein [Ferruginibacter sp.]
MKNQNQPATILCRAGILLTFLLFQLHAISQEAMRANLYLVAANGTKTLMDGNLTNYHNSYSNLVDWDDAWKMTNPGENFGIVRSSTNLVIERRSIICSSDTTFFKMWNMRTSNYEIKVMTKNLGHPGLIAFMKDNYLNAITPVGLNDTTYIPFQVNANPGSYSQLRFELIYTNVITSPVPVTFTGFKLFRKDNNVDIEWSVENEISIESYTVEHGMDGVTFNGLQDFLPSNSSIAKKYTTTDPNVSKGDHFYRIKATSIGGKVEYSHIAKINGLDAGMGLNIYPNPVLNKMVQLQLAFPVAGKYSVLLVGMNGTLQSLGNINISASQSSQTLSLPANTLPGMYRIQLLGPGNSFYIKSITVL